MREPGFYDDIPEREYHADAESLSVSGAKLLLRAPALYVYRLTHAEYRDEFDIGSAAHQLVLGTGPEIVDVGADDWRTKAAQSKRDELRDEGAIPLLSKDYRRVHEMSEALSSHGFATKLLSNGVPELSAYAVDEPTGIMRRGRFDLFGSDVLVDYKTAASAQPEAFAASVARFGYDMQASWYLDLAESLGERRDGFAFVVQEKDPPYLVEVYDIDELALERGARRNRRALDLFERCLIDDEWPGYTGQMFTTLHLPRWALAEEGLT
jgi:hypothetical protein